MKTMKKSFILLLSLVMMLAFALPVSAAGINLSSIKTMRVAKASATVYTNGEEQTISVNGTCTEGANKLIALTATSSNRGVAFVEEPAVTYPESGKFTITYKIKAVGNGKAVITFADKYNAKKITRFSVVSKTYTEGINLTNSCVVYDEENETYSLEVAKGGTVNLGAVVSNSNASDKALVYKSSNKNIAVNARGNVTGRAVVTSPADITITSRDGKSTKTVKVTVSENTKSGKITFAKELNTTKQEAGKLNKSNVLCLTTNVSSKTRNYQLVSTSDYKISDLIFNTNNAKVATVDENGKITALNIGTAKITATPKLGQRVSATVVVKVTTLPEVINMTSSKTTVLANGKDAAMISAVPNAGVNAKAVKLAVYDITGAATKNATVAANGVFRAKVSGTYVVKATVGGVDNSITINAINPTTAVTIAQPKVVVVTRTEDKDYTFELGAKAVGGDVEDLVYTSSNAKVATVDEAGNVTPVGNGTSRIIAKAADGSNKLAYVTVKVTTDAYEISSQVVDEATDDEDGVPVLYVDGTNDKVSVNLAQKIAAVANASASNRTITYWVNGRKVAATVVAKNSPVAVTAKTATGKTLNVILKFVDRSAAVMKYKVEFDSIDDIDLHSGDTAYVAAIVSSDEEDAEKIITANTAKVTYKSSNPTVAAVDATGKIVAKTPGEAVISATFKNPEGTEYATAETVKVYVGTKDAVIRTAVNSAFASTIKSENRDWTGLKAIFNATKANFEFQVLNPKQDLATLENTGLSGASVKALLALEAKGIKILSIDVEDSNGNVYTIERENALTNSLHDELKNIIESAIGSDSVLEKWVGTTYTFSINTCDTKFADRDGLNHKITYAANVTLTDARQKELVDADIASALEGIDAVGVSKIDYDTTSRKAIVYVDDADMTISEFDANRSIFDENLAAVLTNVTQVDYTLTVADKVFSKTEVDEDGNKPISVVNNLFDLYEEKLADLGIDTLEGLDGAIAVAKVTFKVGNQTYNRTYEVKIAMDEATFDEAADNAIETVVDTENQYGTFEFDASTNTAKVVVKKESASLTPIQLDKAYFDAMNRELVAAGKVDTTQETIIILDTYTTSVTGEDYNQSMIIMCLKEAQISKLADLDGKTAIVKVPVKIGSTTNYVTYTIEFTVEKDTDTTSMNVETTEDVVVEDAITEESTDAVVEDEADVEENTEDAEAVEETEEADADEATDAEVIE